MLGDKNITHYREPLNFMFTLLMSVVLFVTSFLTPFLQVKSVSAARKGNTISTDETSVMWEDEFKRLTTATGKDSKNVIGSNKDVTIGKEYTFVARKNSNTVVAPFGVNGQTYSAFDTIKGAEIPLHKDRLVRPVSVNDIPPNNEVTYYRLSEQKPKGVGAKYTNVGYYNGIPVDMKLTVLNWEETNHVKKGSIGSEYFDIKREKPYNPVPHERPEGITNDYNMKHLDWYLDQYYEPSVYFHKEQLGVNIGGAHAEMQYEFFVGGSDFSTPLEVKGLFTFADIDALQGVEIYGQPTNYKNFYVHEDTVMKYQDTKAGVVFADTENINYDPTDPEGMITFTFDSDTVKFKYYQMGRPTKYHPGYTDVNQGAAYFEFIAEKPVRTELADLEKKIVETTSFDRETEVEESEFSKVDEVKTYRIKAKVPTEGEKTKYAKYDLTDELDPNLVFDSEEVKITGSARNSKGERVDKSKNFNVKFDGRKVEISAKEDALQKISDFENVFYGDEYYFDFKVRLKEGIEIPQESLIIPNVANLKTDKDKVKSNEVNLIVHPTLPDDSLSLLKTVNDKELATLSTLDETFKYNLKGIVDLSSNLGKQEYLIEDVLEDGIKVDESTLTAKVEINGKEEQMKPTVNGQKVSLKVDVPASDDAYFDFDISFEAKFDETKAKETLDKHNQFVPNKFKLHYLEKGKQVETFSSNVVYVTSLLENSKKEVNGKKHLDLSSLDETFTYNVKTVIPYDAKTFKIEDVINEDLVILEASNVSTKTVNLQPVVNGQVVSMNLKESDIDIYAGEEVQLNIKVKFADNANIEKYLVEGEDLKNIATIQIDNNPKVETNVVTVKPPYIVKTVDGKTHIELEERNQLFTYEVETTIPQEAKSFTMIDTLKNAIEISDKTKVKGYVLDGKKEIEVDGVEIDGQEVKFVMKKSDLDKYKGKGFLLRMEAKLRNDVSTASYIDGKVPNTAYVETEVDGQLNRIQSNEVTVRTIEDSIEKTVNGVNDYMMLSEDEVVTYTVSTIIPTGAKELVITDTIQNVLEFVGKPTLTKTDGTNVDADISQEGKKLTVKTKNGVAEKLQGEKIYLSFDAKIINGADLSAYEKVDGKIPNVATVQFDNNPEITTNEVTIQKPVLLKQVNGKNHANLVDRNEVFTYTIEGRFPQGHSDFVLTDTVVDELEIMKDSMKLELAAKNYAENDYQLKVDGQTLTLTVQDSFLENFGGATYKVSFDARIKPDADISVYDQHNGRIPNVAVVKVNDLPAVESNEVTVSTDVPSKSINGKDEEVVNNTDQTFKYEIETIVPSNAKDITITDEIAKELEIIGKPTLMSGKEEVKANIKVKDNVVTAKTSKGETEKFAGQAIVLTIEAKIRAGADLSVYDNSLVPNVADVQIDDKPSVKTNEVTVTIEKPVKTVNSKRNEVLADANESFMYEINYKVPSDAKEVKFVDELVKELEIVGTPKVMHGQENVNATVKVDGNQVTATTKKGEAKRLENETITLVIEAKIRAGADLSVYENELVPNVAKIQVDNNPVVETNIATVTVDKPTKKINGKEAEVLKDENETFTYNVNVTVPSDANEIKFTDTLVKELELVKGKEPYVVSGKDKVAASIKVENNTVTATTNAGEAQKFANQVMTLVIEAKVKAGADLSVYDHELVPNTANIQIDNNPTVETNTVTVTFDKPTKTVNGKNEEVLKSFDEEFEYEITTTVPSGAKEVIFKDTLEKELEIVGKPVVMQGENIVNAAIDVDGNVVVAKTREGEAEKYVNQEITLHIKAKVIAGSDLSVFEDEAIPNVATVQFDNNPEITTNEATVKLDRPVKTVNGKDIVTVHDRKETFNYEIAVVVPSDAKEIKITDELEEVLEIVGTPTFKHGEEDVKADIKVDGNKVSVVTKKGAAEKFANKTLILNIEAKIKTNAKVTVYEDRLVPNVASVQFDNNPVVKTNTVTVTVDEPTKTVNGKNAEVLNKETDTFKYEIKALVPSDAKKITFTDKLVKELEIVGTPTIISGEETVEADIVVENNEVRAETLKGQTERFKNEEITLVIEAKVKAGANLTVYKDNLVPNVATVQFDNEPAIETNTVTVTFDKPVKTVNGKNAEVLKEEDEEFVYEVKALVPSDAKEIKFTDKLEKELEIVGEPVVMQDENIVDATITVEDNTVIAITREGEAEKFANKEMKLVIKAKVVAGANLSVFENGEIPNVAQVQFDDRPEVDTNNVTVSIDRPIKTVNGQNGVTIHDRKETFNYEIAVVVPSDAKEIKITDELEKALEIVGEPTLKHNKEDVKADIQVDENKVSVVTQKGAAEKFANQTIVLNIEAKIKEDADLTVYENNQVPNVATVQFDDKPEIKTNTVTVDTDRPVKTVNGKDDWMLSTMDEKVDYEISVIVPKGKKELLITDELVNELKIVDASANLQNVNVKIDEQTVTALIEEEHMAEYVGKELVLTIVAQVKEGVDLDVYRNAQVPNIATVQFDDEPAIETNEVFITPPNKPIKKVNDVEKYQLKDNSEAVKYTVEAMIPRGQKNVVLRDTLVDELAYVPNSAKIYSVDVQPSLEIQDVDVNVNGQELSIELEKEVLEKYEGRKLVLEFNAIVKEDANLEKYANGVPNIAELDVNHGEALYPTNPVYVTPNTPDTPNTDVTNPQDPAQPSKSTGGKFLPQMNTKTTVIPALLGIAAIVAAVIIRQRKKKQNA